MTPWEWEMSEEQRADYMAELAWDDLEAEESFRRFNEALAVGAEIQITIGKQAFCRTFAGQTAVAIGYPLTCTTDAF